MTAQENKEIISGIFEKINQNDYQGTLKFFDDNSQTSIVPRDNIFKGPEGFRQFLQFRKSISSDVKYEVTKIAGCEDTVAVEYVLKGINDGKYPFPEFGEFPPSGKNINLKCCDLITMENGKIINWKSYTDLTTIMRQMGVLHELVHH